MDKAAWASEYGPALKYARENHFDVNPYQRASIGGGLAGPSQGDVRKFADYQNSPQGKRAAELLGIGIDNKWIPTGGDWMDKISRGIQYATEAVVIAGIAYGGAAAASQAASGAAAAPVATTTPATVAAPVATTAPGAVVANPANYGGAVFPTTAANAPTLLAANAPSFSGLELLKTIGSTIKGAAGVITSAKIITNVLGKRKVLPQGADLPPGYTIVGELPKDGNLYPTDNNIPSVSSDGIGFQLPQNSGLLLLALAAFAIMKG